MALARNIEVEAMLPSPQERWERVTQVAASSISGAAGGALLASAFGTLTGVIIGAVAGFVVNAVISSTSV